MEGMKKFKVKELVEWPSLRPPISPVTTFTVLQQAVVDVPTARLIILVGHEPHLAHFLSFILTSKVSDNFHIKKGGFAVIEFKNKIESRQAKLKCLIQPSQIRKTMKLGL